MGKLWQLGVQFSFVYSGLCIDIKWCPLAKNYPQFVRYGQTEDDQPKSVILVSALNSRECTFYIQLGCCRPLPTFGSVRVSVGAPAHHFLTFYFSHENNWFPEDKGTNEQQRLSTSTLKASSDLIKCQVAAGLLWNWTFWKWDAQGFKPGQLNVRLLLVLVWVVEMPNVM